MNRSIITSVVVLLSIIGYSNTAAADTGSKALIEQCRQEAESKTAQNVADYINQCLDELAQYDTSESD